jgi:hypothetical protein
MIEDHDSVLFDFEDELENINEEKKNKWIFISLQLLLNMG